jgi:hypothetical protein
MRGVCLQAMSVLAAHGPRCDNHRSAIEAMDKKMPCCSVQQGAFEFQSAPGISGIVAET